VETLARGRVEASGSLDGKKKETGDDKRWEKKEEENTE
jgi:hypothetical protein